MTNDKTYRVEFTDLFGVKFHSHVVMTRDEARSWARWYRAESPRPMWHNGERCCLSNVRVVPVAA